jgi:2-C-methyl-D-erythritol 4-phosphate cytidylyltransferase
LGKYIEANRRLLPNDILKINGSTEPAVMAGMDIAMIPGDEGNFKITTKADLERMRSLLNLRVCPKV